ncbi:ShlB/FhaC/HecB family hemolysin secretion/activation protein [Novosphingobium sp.]|uniref:ShlB/FhaC/HecB family hemolysin secretion/activation protein n=1 Tax=Novosphingobium sp. TaxID=1874826 RepID=UPI003BA958FB
MPAAGSAQRAWADEAGVQAVPPQAEAAPDTFFIQAFDISGVSHLTQDEVERVVYRFSGPGRTKDDVEAARKAIQDAYAKKGLEAVVVEVPVQDRDSFAQGIVQIAVAEAPAGLIRVVDAKYHSLWVARQQVPSLKEGKPIDFKALQGDLAIANRFPDRSINPEFKPGRIPGTVDVDLRMTDERPLHASVDFNNDASPNTSPLRTSASVRYTNLWQAGHSFAFTYIVAPQNRAETEVFSASYTVPLLSAPWSFSLSGYHSNSNVAAAGGSAVLGKGYQIGLRAIWQLPASRTVQTISFGPDFKSFEQKILVGSTLANSSPIRYIPFEVAYSLAGGSDRSSYQVGLAATVGLRTIKGEVCIVVSGICVPADSFQNREQFSYENFAHVNLNLQYTRNLTSDIEADLRLAGQISDSHLITNEQFAAGGLHSVRGYYSAEAVGDDGVSTNLEVRLPSLANWLAGRGSLFSWLNDARFYGFADTANLYIRNATSGQTSAFHLVGVGGGLRWRMFDKISGELVGAVPLTNGSVTRRGRPRVSFEMRGEF